MKNIGIVCEYNPFHNGHFKQLRGIEGSVCLMSGNFVQRGEPAILDKYVRARAAVECGASLVLELPLTCAVASAERFADGAVEIFERLGCIDGLCFGSEEGDINNIMSTARALLQPEFKEYLQRELETGVSFPTARHRALVAMGADASLIERPNDILAVEYCKALVRRGSSIEPVTIRREGCYHTGTDCENPSASFLRTQDDWEGFVPRAAWELFRTAPKYALCKGERSILARLRSMREADFENVAYGSEGLWSKLMRACREERDLLSIVSAVKSKRYTYSRVMRMILCAFLGITDRQMQQPAPYVRVLAFDDVGRSILRQMREGADIPIINVGQMPPDAAYWELERQANDLFALFSEDILPPGGDLRERVFYKR